jgi:uncharacterized membrane protein
LWTFLILGILLFAVPHAVSSALPGLRDALKSRLGEGRFKGLYSLLSLAGIASFVWAYHTAAPDEVLYVLSAGLRHVLMLVILIAFILIFSNQSKGYIRAWLKHPFSIGIALWATCHILLNGETVVVVIFATLLLLALLDIVFSFARGKFPVFEPNWKHDMRGLVVGVVLYLVFLFGYHPYILGVPVV